MGCTSNLANALLILGALFLWLQYGLEYWIAVILVLWALATWALPERNKELEKAQLDLLRAQTHYYYVKAQRCIDDN